MNTQQIIDNLKARGVEYKVFYETDYPAVVRSISVVVDGEWEKYDADKHFVKTKEDWMAEFYGSCNAPFPRTDIDGYGYGHPADRVLRKVVETLYELRKPQ